MPQVPENAREIIEFTKENPPYLLVAERVWGIVCAKMADWCYFTWMTKYLLVLQNWLGSRIRSV